MERRLCAHLAQWLYTFDNAHVDQSPGKDETACQAPVHVINVIQTFRQMKNVIAVVF